MNAAMPKPKQKRRGRAKTARASKIRKSRSIQETFWAGDFGDAYTSRNRGARVVASNAALFERILRRAGKVHSAIEFGANRGLNLEALRRLVPGIELAALEINAKAAAALAKLSDVVVHHQSIFDHEPRKKYELAIVKGVLIHIAPERLPQVYEVLYRSSSRFICLAEYYNPTPVTVPYRGHREVLFKRDFAGEMLSLYPDLRLVDYGFVYHGDPKFPQDDITWFLLEKSRLKN
jgi:spore coat polysaccharide biosynthesis protein SpsF